jgi:hypothetical protein
MKVSREKLQMMLAETQAQLAQIADAIKLEAVKAQRQELESRRHNSDLWKDHKAAALLLEECDQLDRVIERMDRLQGEQEQMSAAMVQPAKREDLRRSAENIQHHVGRVAQAHRELLRIGDSGHGDALLEIRPIGRARPARDLLYTTYMAWAQERKYRVRMIREPLSDEEPVMISISGPYAFGYLRGEAGHHRVRPEDEMFVVKVSVAVLDKPPGPVTFSVQKALKQTGQYEGRVRARVEITDSELVVQNEGSLADSREVAEALAASWPSNASLTAQNVVRRYDLKPFLLRDYRTGTSSGRAEILHAGPFHELLCKRIDVAAQPAEMGDPAASGGS